MRIVDICSKPAVHVEVEASILDAAVAMREHHVGDVVVISADGNRNVPIGILTDRDIVVELAATGVQLDTVSVGDAMSGDLLVARVDDDLATVVEDMRDRGVRRVPVVDHDNGLVGVLSFDDVVRALTQQLRTLTSTLDIESDRELLQRR